MTIHLVASVSLADSGSAAEVAQWLGDAARTLADVEHAHAGVHCPGAVGGGDLTWDLQFVDDAAYQRFCARGADDGPGLARALGASAGPLTRVAATDAVRLEPLARHVGTPGLVGVKRTLLLRVKPGAPPDARARFEHETPLLARDVPAIRNWRWSRVATGPGSPMESRWTHVWEQEFETVGGLEEDYMASPLHWGHIDGWFDVESPQAIVDPWLAHLYCPASAGVLSW